MTAWASRRDPRGRTTFVSYSAHDIGLLVPPGGAEAPCAELPGEGLWWFGRWPKSDDVLIDFDPPIEARRVTTVWVVRLIDDEFHADVEAIMRRQLEDAWMLCQPAPGRPADDRRTLRHAAMLTSLYKEIQAAFPTHDQWHTEVDAPRCTTDAYDQLLMVPHHAASMEPPRGESELSVLVIVSALVKAMWARVCGRSVVGTVYIEHRADQPAQTHAPALSAPCESPPEPLAATPPRTR
jgi:hypothetical protein